MVKLILQTGVKLVMLTQQTSPKERVRIWFPRPLFIYCLEAQFVYLILKLLKRRNCALWRGSILYLCFSLSPKSFSKVFNLKTDIICDQWVMLWFIFLNKSWSRAVPTFWSFFKICITTLDSLYTELAWDRKTIYRRKVQDKERDLAYNT